MEESRGDGRCYIEQQLFRLHTHCGIGCGEVADEIVGELGGIEDDACKLADRPSRLWK